MLPLELGVNPQPVPAVVPPSQASGGVNMGGLGAPYNIAAGAPTVQPQVAPPVGVTTNAGGYIPGWK